MGGAAVAQRAQQLRPMPIVRSQNLAVADRRLGDGAVDLASGFRLFVQQHHRRAPGRRQRRRGQTGRAGADHGDVEVEPFALGAHRSTSRLPFWVSTAMPGDTRTWQPWRLPVPSMVTRQSKHTPIMQ